MLIGENNEAPEIQLSEFQPRELTPVPPAIIVTNNNDAGPGSLRAALAASATFDTASTITFAPTLSGATITLTSGPLVLDPSPGVTVDASALAAGLTISGNNAARLFTIAPATNAALVPGTGNPITTTFGPTTGFAELFYRVRTGP